MCNSPFANMAVLRAVAVCVVLLHKHDLQTSACKSRVILPLVFPDFFFLPSIKGSFCRNGEEPVLILIRSFNPSSGRIQNSVKTLLIFFLFVLGGLVWGFFEGWEWGFFVVVIHD